MWINLIIQENGHFLQTFFVNLLANTADFFFFFFSPPVLFQQGRSHSRPVVLLFQRALLQYKNTYFDIQQNKIYTVVNIKITF